jgi:hypothetical protein
MRLERDPVALDIVLDGDKRPGIGCFAGYQQVQRGVTIGDGGGMGRDPRYGAAGMSEYVECEG